MKARFDVQQPSVLVKTYDDNTYVFICINEQHKTEILEGESTSFYEYDYHEFCEKTTNLNTNDIHAHPEKYLRYEPKREPTESERLETLESQNQMLTDCVLEMSMLLYQ